MTFNKKSNGYIHLYDSPVEDTTVFGAIYFIIEAFIATMISIAFLIIPYLFGLSVIIMNYGQATSFEKALEIVPILTTITSLLSLLITLPYSYVRQKRHGRKMYIVPILTCIMLFVLLTIATSLLSIVGSFGY